MDNRLDLHDWVLIGDFEIGKVWAIQGSFAIVHVRHSNGLLDSHTFPIPMLTKITKEVADIMRAV